MGDASSKPNHVCKHCKKFATARHRLKDDSGVLDVVYSCGSSYCVKKLGVKHWPIIVCDQPFSTFQGGLFANPHYCVCGDKVYTVVEYRYVGKDDKHFYHLMPGSDSWMGGFSYMKWCGYMDCEARAPLPDQVPEDFEFVRSFVSPAGRFYK